MKDDLRYSSFTLSKSDYKKVKEWLDHCDTYAGAAGGRTSYIFTPTGLGMCLTVECICGEKLDLTDVSDW